MRTRVAKWGNSLAVRIPAAVAEEVNLHEGDALVLQSTPDGLTLIRETAELTMAEMLAGVTDDNIHEYVDFGPAVGKELL
jgi:antitoxin MazE